VELPARFEAGDVVPAERPKKKEKTFDALGNTVLTAGLSLPGGCQIGYTCDQNSTYGLHSLPGGVRLVTWNIPAVIKRCFDCNITWRKVVTLQDGGGGRHVHRQAQDDQGGEEGGGGAFTFLSHHYSPPPQPPITRP
jgi:hypothetical protein